MVVKTVDGDIFKTDAKHIAFAINKEGINDAGFAGNVAYYWPELEYCGAHEIGTVLSKTIGEKTFHALVCHSLKEGWGEDQAETIKECFNNIPVDDEEPIASIAIGTGFVGMMSGADFKQIASGMMTSSKKVALHTGYTLEQIKEFHKEVAGVPRKKTRQTINNGRNNTVNE